MVMVVKRRDPRWLDRLLKRYANGPVLALGWPTGSQAQSLRYPDGTSVVLVAAVNQFGSISRGIPQRDFLTPGNLKALEVTQPITTALVPALNAGKITVSGILTKMGPFAQGAVQDTIRDFTTPGNSERTIARKGDDNPLEDTGLMRQSLTWVVRAK